MSEILGELARVRDAFDKPTLRLVEQKWAPVILAVFRSSFGNQRKAILAERLHTQVETHLGELRHAGDPTPDGTGRSLCLAWMHAQWLYRDTGPDGDEQYSLTSHALEALTLIDSLSRDRALISESRLSMILADVHKWATEANPDREVRIIELDTRIAELTAERDRLVGGGEIVAASDDRMLDGYSNLIDLISQLPGDFARVGEAMSAMHRGIVNDFRTEDRPIGQVIDEYLDRTDHLMAATPEGRAFDGAFALLRDDALLAELNRDLTTITSHPFAEVLTATERRTFTGTVAVISDGLRDVLDQRRRLTNTLREHIVRHDVVKDRELDLLLREVTQELSVWLGTAGPHAKVPVELIPPGRDRFAHVKERFSDAADDTPPPPLRDHAAETVKTTSLEELRRQGGPRLDELTDAIHAAVDDGARSVGEVFGTLPVDLRRPVEILGLVQLAARIDALAGADGTETFEAVRPDGTTRTFAVPRIPLAPDDTDALTTETT